jgi:cell division protein FtsB
MNVQTQAILNELGQQRSVLGDRAASIAGELAVVKAENEALKARIKQLEERAGVLP